MRGSAWRSDVRTLLVTNFVTHYRAPFFERLSKVMDVEFLLCTDGTEEFWQPHLGTTDAAIRSTRVVGRPIMPGLSFNPAVLGELRRRDYDVVIKCINGRFELAGTYAIAKARDIPFVFWMEIWWHPMNALGWLSYPALHAVERGADAIVTDGPQMSAYVAGSGIDPRKIFTATLAVDNDLFLDQSATQERAALRHRLGVDDERPVILAVARLRAEKGLDILLQAAGRLGDLHPLVVIAGTGPLEREVSALAEAEGVDLRLTGGLKPREMPAMYRAADLYAMPSITLPTIREPWGLGVNEAMCAELPVVVSDAVGAAAGRLAEHRETALVVPERDVDALARAMRTMLTDRVLRERLVAAALERVQTVTLDEAASQFKAAAEYAVEHHRRRRTR